MQHGITVNESAGNINFDIPTKVGDVRVTLGGPDDEFAYIDSIGVGYSYRGRYYTGRIILDNRKNYDRVNGYSWYVKDAGGKTASLNVYQAISEVVIAALREYLARRPEIRTRAELARVRKQADNLFKQIGTAERELAEMRAEHRKLIAKAEALWLAERRQHQETEGNS